MRPRVILSKVLFLSKVLKRIVAKSSGCCQKFSLFIFVLFCTKKTFEKWLNLWNCCQKLLFEVKSSICLFIFVLLCTKNQLQLIELLVFWTFGKWLQNVKCKKKIKTVQTFDKNNLVILHQEQDFESCHFRACPNQLQV